MPHDERGGVSDDSNESSTRLSGAPADSEPANVDVASGCPEGGASAFPATRTSLPIPTNGSTVAGASATAFRKRLVPAASVLSGPTLTS